MSFVIDMKKNMNSYRKLNFKEDKISKNKHFMKNNSYNNVFLNQMNT